MNGRELLLTIEATLVDLLPLPEDLSLKTDIDISATQLGSWSTGQLLEWDDAWAVLRHPDFGAEWHVVPLHGGRLVLAPVSALPEQHRQAAALWQERAVGLLLLTHR